MFKRKSKIISISFSKGLESRYSIYFDGNPEEKEEIAKLTLSGEILLNKDAPNYEWCYKFFKDAEKLSVKELMSILKFLKKKYPKIKSDKDFDDLEELDPDKISEMLLIMAIPVELERRQLKD